MELPPNLASMSTRIGLPHGRCVLSSCWGWQPAGSGNQIAKVPLIGLSCYYSLAWQCSRCPSPQSGCLFQALWRCQDHLEEPMTQLWNYWCCREPLHILWPNFPKPPSPAFPGFLKANLLELSFIQPIGGFSQATWINFFILLHRILAPVEKNSALFLMHFVWIVYQQLQIWKGNCFEWATSAKVP